MFDESIVKEVGFGISVCTETLFTFVLKRLSKKKMSIIRLTKFFNSTPLNSPHYSSLFHLSSCRGPTGGKPIVGRAPSEHVGKAEAKFDRKLNFHFPTDRRRRRPLWRYLGQRGPRFPRRHLLARNKRETFSKGFSTWVPANKPVGARSNSRNKKTLLRKINL